MNDSNKKEAPVEALRRGLVLLDHLSSHPDGLMLAELSGMLSLQRTTVHNLLKTLVYSGYAENDGTGRYRLGWRIRELWRIQRLDHCPGLTPLMESLTREIGESLILTQLSDGHRQVLYHTESTQAVQVSTRFVEQSARSIWELETGLVLAAYSRPEVLARIIDVNGMPADIPSHQKLDTRLEQIRTDGFISLEHAGIFAMAVPVLDDDGALLGALGINQPLFRHKDDDNPSIIQYLRRGAQQIAATLEL